MKPVRILFLIPRLVVGGAERQLLVLASQLDRRRFAAMVGALAEGGGLWPAFAAAKLPLKVFRRAWPQDPRPIMEIAVCCRAHRIDIVHSFLFLDGFYGRLAAALAGGVRTVASARGVEYTPGSLRAGVDRALARLTTALVANSEWMRRRLTAEGFPQRVLLVIPNGADVAHFRPGAVPPEPRLREVGEVVGSVGRLVPVKDYETFLRACALVARERPQTRFLIVGDGPERERLETLAVSLGLRERLILPGEVTDVRPFLAGMSVFALASRSESLPGALLEAMAFGLPCVATRVGGVPEAATDGCNALLVSPAQPEALAAAILRLLNDGALRAQLGRAARESVCTRFSLAAMVQSYEALYERLVHSTRWAAP